MAVTGQGYGRFHFIEPPLTCVTFMTCYITFKLPFIPASLVNINDSYLSDGCLTLYYYVF